MCFRDEPEHVDGRLEIINEGGGAWTVIDWDGDRFEANAPTAQAIILAWASVWSELVGPGMFDVHISGDHRADDYEGPAWVRQISTPSS